MCFSFTDKTLNRGISRATDNVNIVSRVRSELALVDNADEEYLAIETPVYTFTLPDFSQFPGNNFKLRYNKRSFIDIHFNDDINYELIINDVIMA